jgi:shikimate 5-dehydrogenase
MLMRDVIRQVQPTMYFIGVSTSKSSIMQIFPLWMKELGRSEVVLQGVDLALHDTAENYRRAVQQVKEDPLSLGALVTTHKINLLEATRDMFDYLDRYAVVCDEISCISKKNGRLEGHAKDPITCGLSFDAFVPSGHFGRSGGHILCLGAGGAATALILHLARKQSPADRPKRMIVVNRSEPRLQALSEMVRKLGTDIVFEYHCQTDSRLNDELMGNLPPGSVVINATGMGKDLPGSPITDSGVFPEHGIAWELNYRGELEFLRQAVAQRDTRRISVEDGWQYFLHGWTQVISEVLSMNVSGAAFERLSAIAAEICTPALPLKSSTTAPVGVGERP